MKRYLSLTLALVLLISCLVGCGASTMEMGNGAISQSKPMDPGYGMDMDATSDKLTAGSTAPTEDGSEQITEESTTATPQQMSEKIIYSAYVEMETLEFEDSISALEKAVADIGGFIENSSVSGDSSYSNDGSVQILNRRAYYTVRVPVAKFNDFLTYTDGLGNVISSSKNAENVTSQYMDFEARLTSLRTEETRLLELMAKADDIDALISLEARLSEVRYDIEAIQRNLSNLDNRIAYSSVDLTIREVRVYQPTASVKRSFWQRLGDSFVRGWENFVDNIGDFFVGLAGSIFPLLIFAGVVVVVVILVRKIVKKKKSKKSEE